jgi:hypothetical protein
MSGTSRQSRRCFHVAQNDHDHGRNLDGLGPLSQQHRKQCDMAKHITHRHRWTLRARCLVCCLQSHLEKYQGLCSEMQLWACRKLAKPENPIRLVVRVDTKEARTWDESHDARDVTGPAR